MRESLRWVVYVAITGTVLLAAMLNSQIPQVPEPERNRQMKIYASQQEILADSLKVPAETSEIWYITHWLEDSVKVRCVGMPKDQACPLCTGESQISIPLYGVTNDINTRCTIHGKPPSTGRLEIDLEEK